MPNDTAEIIFLSNSLTDDCDWAELFRNSRIKNRGIKGDDISGIINRLNEVVESRSSKIFLLIGTNDLSKNKSINTIIADYEKLIHLIKTKTPRTELYVQSILPTYNQKNRNNYTIIAINEKLQELAKKYNCVYIDLFTAFKNPKNELDAKYLYDGIHLTAHGYFLWKKLI